MFMVGVTEWGLKTCEKIQEDYNKESWIPLKRNFRPPPGRWGTRPGPYTRGRPTSSSK